ncbi:MAG: hypothetical protein J6125_05015, partial [Clostridia bacterium]|nr:hypothetical protein [Clostridia bacterium]
MHIDTDRRAFFEQLLEKTRQNLRTVSDRLDVWYEQYKGSTKIDGSSEEASAVRNISYEIVESQVDSTIPPPKVDAGRYSEHRSRNALAVEHLCGRLRDRLPFEKLNDIDERYTYILGGSVWLVEWDHLAATPDGHGEIRISCLSPRDFFPQPGIYEVRDMEYCFLRFVTTGDELTRRWHVPPEQVRLAETDGESDLLPGGDTVTVYLCYYRDDEGEVGRFLWSGELTLEDMPRYFFRKREVCAVCRRPAGSCDCPGGRTILADEVCETPARDYVRSDGTVIPCLTATREVDFSAGEAGGLFKKTEIPYYVPRDFPIVIRKNTSCDKQLLGQSDCEFLRPIQQQINKVESRILQKLMRAAVTPIVPEDAQITLSNRIFGQVIKLRPGESAADYGTVDTTPDISRDIAQAERLYQHAKRLIGISDAFVGLDNIEISGYSRQLQLSQSAGRLESKRRMKYAAYADIDRLIFGYYLAYADEPRCVDYKDAAGRICSCRFDRRDFLEWDAAAGRYVYDDDYLFSVDLNATVTGERSAQWERNLANLTSGTLGDPADPATLLRYWQLQERVHYPFARENVEHFKSLIEAASGIGPRPEPEGGEQLGANKRTLPAGSGRRAARCSRATP